MESPTKLTITRARVRNFLSYGNEWQEVVFSKGLTLVQGFNVDTRKSNGSGKSSITEIIPFALFGKTIKDLPQAKIVNWNNRSACEVQLFIDMGRKSYVFKRGLKPNKFKVSCDGQDIVRPADIRAFQTQIEEEIIGMDFKTFKNLIYFSPNNTISILGASKEQKRLFLESLFDLSEYSELLRLTNEKIRDFSDRVSQTETLKSISASLIVEKGKDIDSLSAIPINQAEAQLNSNTNKLALFLKSSSDAGLDREPSAINYDLIKNHLGTLKELQTTLGISIGQIKTKIEYIQKDIDSTDLTSLETKTSSITNEIISLETIIDNCKGDVDQFNIDLPNIKASIDTLSVEKIELESMITTCNQTIALKNQLVMTCKDNIFKLENADQLEKVSECPLCKSKVDHVHIASWYIEEINNEYHRMRDIENIISDLKIELSGYSGKLEALKSKGKELVEEYKIKQQIISNNIDNYFSLEALKKNLKMLPDINVLKDGLTEKKVSIETLNTELSDLAWKFDLNKADIEAKELEVSKLEDIKKKYLDYKTMVDTLTRDIESSRINLNNIITIKRNQDEQIEAKKKDIDKHTKSIVVYEEDIKKFNIMLDHLNYMRTALKDENVKQFAISALLPYLNHRANHYLSESGFPYMVSIDGWLDVVIRGMGTEDVGYNSLSGGESKAMDMAVQLACNDIAELQAKTSLNIAIYDEILDTSLDADGVQKLMDIVRVKQQETNSCVLCITHRDEIKELEFDNSIMIYKQNGFSVIQH